MGKEKIMGKSYNLGIIIFVCVCLHIPDDLVSKELRELRCLKNITLYISKRVVSKSLDDLRHIEERNIH